MPRSVSSTSPPRSNKSPIRTERRRSRSPQREKDRPRRRDGGFKWKEKRRNDEGEEDREGDRRLERGYREHYRARSPKREQDRDIRERDQERDNQEASRKEKDSKEKKEKKEKKKKKEKQADAVVPSGEAMIIVNVNDRLGTKAAIPCYASDPIKLFKAQLAARIGREPHEILLKRQGERPFKDQLTLEDYGVSNGVQLDLEVDTGD